MRRYPRMVSRYKTKWNTVAECWEVAPGSLETGFEFRCFSGKLRDGERKIYKQLRLLGTASKEDQSCQSLGIVDIVTNETLCLAIIYGRAFLTLGTTPIAPEVAERIANQNPDGLSRLLGALKAFEKKEAK